ncbi:MAG: type II toxin-antitoxin system RelE/ParE family toxin [Planctomycetia bacterium]|nr:type II toxin-antitoxin system RelE/ParE family toxin [Planctomycetia bacterium]
MKYDVAILRRAREDIDGILEWLTTRSPQGARHWHDAYISAYTELRRSADMFPPSPYSRRLGIRVRCFPFGTSQGNTYQIFYAIDEDMMQVRILRVQSPGQRPLRRKDLL